MSANLEFAQVGSVRMCQACGYLVSVPRPQRWLDHMRNWYFIGREAVHQECRESADLCPCCEGLRFCEVCTASVVYSFLRADVCLKWWACARCQEAAGDSEPERGEVIGRFVAWRKVAVNFPDFLGKPLIEPWREFGLEWEDVATLRDQIFDEQHRWRLREVLGKIKLRGESGKT